LHYHDPTPFLEESDWEIKLGVTQTYAYSSKINNLPGIDTTKKGKKKKLPWF
jgi:hypothetical protein